MQNYTSKSKSSKPSKKMDMGSMGQVKSDKPNVVKPAVPAWRTNLQRVLQTQMDSMVKQKPRPKPKKSK